MALLRVSLCALLMLLIRASAADPLGVVPPVEPGGFAVACSNVAQNFGLAPTDKPLWADAAFHYPLILYSHGLDGSPLSAGYLETIMRFASYGYVVAAPFHGDPRFANVHYDGLSDLVRLFLLGGFDQLVEMQAVRPHSLRVLLDALLSHPDLRDHIDPGRIAGFGASLGGESLLLFAGAELTTSVYPRLRAAQVMKDARLIAMVGYVPYFGQRLLPAFGNDQGGLRGITMPFMAISGTADTSAPIELTEQGVNNMAGSRYLVAFIRGFG